MGTLTYEAVDRGNLVAGHSEGTEYTIELDFERFDDGSDRKINEIKSLSGKKTTRFHRKELFAAVGTIWVDDLATQLQLIEFFDSLDAGEDFALDPYGTIASPVENITATLKGNPSKARYKKMERFKYSFNIEIQSN